MKKSNNIHENLHRKTEIRIGSSRSFGTVFTVVFAILGLWPLIKGETVHLWALGVSALLLMVTLTRPRILNPLNYIWFRFGLLLHAVINPIVMVILFYGTVTPIALVMRMVGKDPLRLEYEPSAESYWIIRDPPGPAPDTFKNQF